MEPMTEATGKAIVERLDKLIELLTPKKSMINLRPHFGFSFTEEDAKKAAEALGVPYQPGGSK